MKFCSISSCYQK